MRRKAGFSTDVCDLFASIDPETTELSVASHELDVLTLTALARGLDTEQAGAEVELDCPQDWRPICSYGPNSSNHSTISEASLMQSSSATERGSDR